MPPKKKKGGKKKGKKKKDDAELELEDKYRKTMDEIEALKDHLAIRKEIARRSQSMGDEWKAQVKQAENQVQELKDDHQSVSADMTRQYKTMQTDLSIQIHDLKTKLERTQRELEKTQQDLADTRAERDKIIKEKDSEILDLQVKIQSQEEAYEKILNNTLDSLSEKIKNARLVWVDKESMIAQKNKATLLEFGLNPLDL